MKPRVVLFMVLLVALPGARAPRAQQTRAVNVANVTGTSTAVLAPTLHPPVPGDLSLLWLAPDRGTEKSGAGASTLVANAARLVAGGEFTKALSLVSPPAARDGVLGQYATYYAGISQLRLQRLSDAMRTFRTLQDQKPVGYLAEAAQLGEAETDEASDNPAAAVQIYERLLRGRPSDLEDLYMRLGRAARSAGESTRAAEAFGHVFYESPLNENAAAAGSELNALTGLTPITPGSPRYTVEFGRADRLFTAKMYADARSAYEMLLNVSSEDDLARIQVRIAETDYFRKRTRIALDALRPLTGKGVVQAEALYFYGLASRDAGDVPTFLQSLERVKTDFASQTWAEDSLDALALYHLKKNEDDQAEALYRELYNRYPRGAHAEDAAWKTGWTAYRKTQYGEVVRVFEQAAADFPRSDYRPGWLYWVGRAHEQLGEFQVAQDRYLLAGADYLNSYYGRLALKRLPAATVARIVAVRATPDQTSNAPTLPANGAVVRALLAAGLYDDALSELRYAQRAWGDSPAIEATIAWSRQQQARSESGMKRFQLLRGSINTMKRAYPQFLAAGGEDLPREVLTVIFPIAYWDAIRRHSETNGLDPYLVAALVAQESTFVADVKSYANAYGLMQLLPGTAQQYARKLSLPYSSRLLTDPDANIRMGTAYLADKIREFGGDVHLALASYNAGERAVHRWQAERQGLGVDEFIDDIPYPQTQNYVKRILGTADDYRRIYGDATEIDGVDTTARPALKAAAAIVVTPAPKKTAPSRPRASRKSTKHPSSTRKAAAAAAASIALTTAATHNN